MASVRLEDVDKVYPNGHVAARDLNLEIADGELLVLVGPSGCGKSTALRLIAGLETPTAGRIWFDDREVTGLAPQERDIAMVFQSYALYPHMSVRGNLAFGLRMRGTPKAEIPGRVERAARALGLERLLDRKPAQLSGGQRQRVALGRAIVRDPKVFLFDEPLSNLDAKLRVETRAELARLHRRLAATMVYVTHDQEEAMTLGQRVAVMKDGALQQVAPPMELYGRPANAFVGEFVGSPAMNFLPATVAPADDGWLLEGRGFSIFLRNGDGAGATRGEAGAEAGSRRSPAADEGTASPGGAGDRPEEPPGPEPAPGAPVLVGVRPHDVELVGPDEGDARARVDVVEPLGSEVLLHLDLAGREGEEEFRAVVPPDRAAGIDETVGVGFRRDRIHLFERDSGARLQPPGD